jgi:hypothetical protein
LGLQVLLQILLLLETLLQQLKHYVLLAAADLDLLVAAEEELSIILQLLSQVEFLTP